MHQGGNTCHKGCKETPITSVPPSAVQEIPLGVDEIMRHIMEVEQLEGQGRAPLSSPTQQLAQMAAEVGPYMLGREEPARRKL